MFINFILVQFQFGYERLKIIRSKHLRIKDNEDKMSWKEVFIGIGIREYDECSRYELRVQTRFKHNSSHMFHLNNQSIVCYMVQTMPLLSLFTEEMS